MRRLAGTAIVLAHLLLAAPVAHAGGKSYRCPEPTQTCLDEMVARLRTSGWLGIEYDDSSEASPFKVTKVVAGSPAEAGGFRVGDLLVSVNGARFADNTEDRCVTCERTKEIWKPGGKVHYVVVRSGKEVQLDATLAPLPPDVMALMVGMHMIQHAQPAAPSN